MFVKLKLIPEFHFTLITCSDIYIPGTSVGVSSTDVCVPGVLSDFGSRWVTKRHRGTTSIKYYYGHIITNIEVSSYVHVPACWSSHSIH